MDASWNSVQSKCWSAVIIYRLVMETCLSAFSTTKVALLSGMIPASRLTAYFGVFTSTVGRQLRWLKKSYCVWDISNQFFHTPLLKKNGFLNSKLDRRKWKRSKEILHLHSHKFKFGIVILCFPLHKRGGKRHYYQ